MSAQFKTVCIEILCDKCGRGFRPPADTLSAEEARQAAKAYGWISDGFSDLDLCAVCVDKSTMDAAKLAAITQIKDPDPAFGNIVENSEFKRFLRKQSRELMRLDFTNRRQRYESQWTVRADMGIGESWTVKTSSPIHVGDLTDEQILEFKRTMERSMRPVSRLVERVAGVVSGVIDGEGLGPLGPATISSRPTLTWGGFMKELTKIVAELEKSFPPAFIQMQMKRGWLTVPFSKPEFYSELIFAERLENDLFTLVENHFPADRLYIFHPGGHLWRLDEFEIILEVENDGRAESKYRKLVPAIRDRQDPDVMDCVRRMMREWAEEAS